METDGPHEQQGTAASPQGSCHIVGDLARDRRLGIGGGATRIAIELAKMTGDALLVVTVWRELRADFGIPITAIFPDAVDIERDHARDLANDVAARAAAAGVAVETIIRHGSPSREICDAAAEHQPRLVVMGTNGWGRVGQVLFGSVSESVLHHAPCPVLVVPGDEEQASRTEHIRRRRND